MQALLYRGTVIHARTRPIKNRFAYPVFWLRLRMDALPDAVATSVLGWNRWRLLSMFQRDYGARDGSAPLPWLQQQLARAGVNLEMGEVWLQTFPRVLGYSFNPASFWLCHDRQGALKAVLVEVNNTFGDWCNYVLTAPDGGAIGASTRMHCQKIMHVSPFCEITGHYEFRLRETPQGSTIVIDYHDAEGLLIHAAIAGKGEHATSAKLWRAVLTQPFITFGVMAKIHWQALKLWLGKVSFHRQPAPLKGGFARSQPIASFPQEQNP